MEQVEVKNKTLLDLSKEAFEIEQEIIAAGGEIDSFMEAKMNEVAANLERKVDAYDWRMNAILARAEQFKKRATEFDKVGSAMKKYCDALKDRIKLVMKDVLKKDELHGQDVRFKMSKAKPKMIIDEQLLPKGLFKIIQTQAPDKERIQELLDKGEKIPGVTLEDSFSLRTYPNRKT